MATMGQSDKMPVLEPSGDVDVPTLSELHARLDSLWTVYLSHLDHYTASQKLLQKYTSSGFLSLARANFNARSGMRFGKDYFHERAVATRRATINGDSKDQASQIEIMELDAEQLESRKQDQDDKSNSAESEEPKQQPSPPATPRPAGDTHDEEDHATKDQASIEKVEGQQDDQASLKLQLESDPIRWFGILVPRELRSAQASFISAMDETVAQSVNAAKSMRDTEVEIRRVRKEIRRAEKAHEG